MHKISIPYLGRSFDFTYYSTTINEENLYFVITNDPVAKELLIEDHFFIRLAPNYGGLYWFNAIKATEEENNFKEHIAREILIRWMVPQSPSAMA